MRVGTTNPVEYNPPVVEKSPMSEERKNDPSVQPDRQSSAQKDPDQRSKADHQATRDALEESKLPSLDTSHSENLPPIEDLIEEFQMDPKTQAVGLTAEVEGKGPGLKIVLRDGAGRFIRQFSEKEFSRLHDSSTNEGGPRGKILDQKS